MSVLSIGQRSLLFDDQGYEISQTSIPTVKFKALSCHAIMPTRATEGAACWDLYALDTRYLGADRARLTMETGIAIELPPGYVGMVCSRSGLASKRGLFVLNAPGIIDADYRGELKVILGWQPFNYMWVDLETICIEAGDRIAQLMVMPLPQLAVEEVTELSTTDRGENGFGSTGI
jgi:dUTP pyrophosphatase